MIKWWILLIISLVGFTMSAAVFLPRLFLKKSSLLTPCDRGIKKAETPDGRSILFEPVPEMRKYVRQYILSERCGKKSMVCRIDEGISYLDYDVAVFNEFNRVFKILHVKEIVEPGGYTREVALPPETAYVSLTLNEADEKRFPKNTRKSVSRRRRAAFAAIIAAVSVAEVIFLTVCCAHLFGGIFEESFLSSQDGALLTCAVCGSFTAVVNSICFLLAGRNGGGGKHGKKSAEGEE